MIPLAKKLEECGVFGVTSDECLNYALENRKEWEMKGKGIVEEMVEKVKKSKKVSVPAVIKQKAGEMRSPTGSKMSYYARRSATFMMPLPRGSLRGDSRKGGVAEMEGSFNADSDEDSIAIDPVNPSETAASEAATSANEEKDAGDDFDNDLYDSIVFEA